MNSNISLKLHAFGIKLLHDPNWTGMELFDKLKQHVRQRIEPKNMLYETIQNGLLYHLGMWTFEEFLEEEERFNGYLDLSHEYLLWYLEDYVELLVDAGVDRNHKLLEKVNNWISKFDDLYEKDEQKYYDLLNKKNKKLKNLCVKLSRTFAKELEQNKPKYSEVFAERVFHDRTLCEFISKIILLIGFDGTSEDGEEPNKWIDRRTFPAWAKKAVISRERGKCADCGKDLIQELEDNYHFDHILPLSKGGTNDLSNLQLLCGPCNLTKSNNPIPVKSSIPNYLQLREKRT